MPSTDSKAKQLVGFMTIPQDISRTTAPNISLFVLILMYSPCWFQIWKQNLTVLNFLKIFFKNHPYLISIGKALQSVVAFLSSGVFGWTNGFPTEKQLEVLKWCTQSHPPYRLTSNRISGDEQTRRATAEFEKQYPWLATAEFENNTPDLLTLAVNLPRLSTCSTTLYRGWKIRLPQLKTYLNRSSSSLISGRLWFAPLRLYIDSLYTLRV